jgi:diguanylate cyclase (GGDEF)-like protein
MQPVMGTASPDTDPRRIADTRRVDIERRLRPRRRAVFAVLMVAVLGSGPSIGWWPVAPLLVAIVAPALLQRPLVDAAHPERWEALAWMVGPAMIAVSVALSGGPRSPALAWFVMPTVTLRIRFRGRYLRVGVAFLLSLVALSTVAVDPAGFAASPQFALFAAALLVAVSLLISAVTEAERDFRLAAGVDPLTRLPNRLTLESDFALLAGALQAARGSMAMLTGDLVGFKQVNDLLGHPAGDEILRQVAALVHGALRPGDRVYRIGGDEFLILLPGTTRTAAVLVAERLAQVVAVAPALPAPISIRFGAAAAHGEAISFDALYAAADRELIRTRQRPALDEPLAALA